MITAADRQGLIMERLREKGHVTVLELSAEFEVSSVTIRKDLQALEAESLLYRTHGGAHLRNPHVTDRPLSEKASIRAKEKERIGKAAAAYVGLSDSIILGSGTTTASVARYLPSPAAGMKVVTSAMNCAVEAASHSGIETMMLGGIVRLTSTSVAGPHAESFLAQTTCDTLFLGVDGFDVMFGLTTSNALEASLNQAMMRSARRVVVVCDASKFGRRGFSRICGASEIDLVITDAGVPVTAIEALHEMGVAVEIA
jgi:DeoR family transcriptional regulator, aga operon transcriptional repressor